MPCQPLPYDTWLKSYAHLYFLNFNPKINLFGFSPYQLKRTALYVFEKFSIKVRMFLTSDGDVFTHVLQLNMHKSSYIRLENGNDKVKRSIYDLTDSYRISIVVKHHHLRLKTFLL